MITRRWIPDAKETSQVVLAQQAHALVLALVLVVCVGLAGGAIMPTQLSPLGLASAIGSGALYYAGRTGSTSARCATFRLRTRPCRSISIPIVGVSAGAILLGERLDPLQWVGAIVVLGAVLAILRRPTAAPAATGSEATTPATT